MSRKRRSYSLIFGAPLTLDEDFFISPLTRGNTASTITLEDYYSATNTKSATLITKHNISFKVQKSEGVNNKAEVTIDNLSKNSRAYLTSHKNSNLVVVLKVGYGDENKLLFQGTMTDCSIIDTGNTSKTKLSLTDGGLNTSSAYSTRVYPKGTKVKRVVEDLITDLACPIGNSAYVNSSDVLADYYSIYGETNRALQRLLSAFGYVGTIDNGAYTILPIGKQASVQASYISPTSGLLGRVTYIDKKSKPSEKTATSTASKQRIRFTCQMDATLSPQRTVWVEDESTNVNGAFKIEKSNFSGSFESGLWTTTVEAVSLDAIIIT